MFNWTSYGRVGLFFLQVDDDGSADDRVVDSLVDELWFGDGFWVDGKIVVDLLNLGLTLKSMNRLITNYETVYPSNG